MGSTDAARRAGIKLDTITTTIIPTSAIANDFQSPGKIPNSIDRINCAPPYASGNPTATAIALITRLSRSTIHST